MTVTELSTAVGLVITMIGGWIFLDTRHAHDTDVLQLAGVYTKQFDKVNRQLIEIRIKTLEDRLWYLMERTQCLGPIARECKHLRNEIEELKAHRK